MAGFKCDVCGGKIIMQANKTGVCQNCGMEYDIEAVRSMAGTAQSSPPQEAEQVIVDSPADNPNELDREALITYLDDLRVLESILSESRSKHRSMINFISQKNEELADFKRNCLPVKPNEPQKMTVFLWKPKIRLPLLIISIILAIGGFICFVVDDPLIILLQFLLFLTAAILFMLFALSLTIHLLRTFSHNHKAKKNIKKHISSVNEKYESDIKVYEAKMAEFRTELSKREAEFNELNEAFCQKSGDILKEQDEFSKLLEKAYSANIIPKPFRTIEGVYYLYDYLSTSNPSLSEALTQANLEAIKQKIDNMIRLQSAQIIQQAQANAKLDRVIKISEATMNNTAVAAKYAQICSINSELSVKLAKESLFYQRWAFFLM